MAYKYDETDRMIDGFFGSKAVTRRGLTVLTDDDVADIVANTPKAPPPNMLTRSQKAAAEFGAFVRANSPRRPKAKAATPATRPVEFDIDDFDAFFNDGLR